MNLSEEQTAAVRSWISAGESLANVQKLLESEFEMRITYMDLRFLVDDLQLEINSAGPQFTDLNAATMEKPAAAPGTVSVTLDKITRPDALVSGQVTFSDGVTAQWHMDQTGRLALNASQPGYQPPEEDLPAFQTELRNAVEKSGMM